MNVSVDERLSAVLSELKEGDNVADIGCDHGKIANLAVEITKNAVFATDISEPSLMKAKALAEETGQADKVICLVGDGLKPLENTNADTVVIAGMGGHEIIKILSEATCRYKKYVLVPHRNAPELRRYLSENEFGVVRDYYVKSAGKFYPVIVIMGRRLMNYTQYGYHFGLTRDKVEKEYAAHRLATLKALEVKATGKRKDEILEEIKIIENED